MPISLWTAFFDKDDLTAFDSKFLRFVGEFNRAEATAGKSPIVRVSLLAGKHPMRLVFPKRRFNVAHGFNWIPAPNITITWGSQNYAVPAPTDRQTGADPPPPPGGDIPPPSDIGPPTIEPRGQPILSDRRNRPGGGQEPGGRM